MNNSTTSATEDNNESTTALAFEQLLNYFDNFSRELRDFANLAFPPENDDPNPPPKLEGLYAAYFLHYLLFLPCPNNPNVEARAPPLLEI